MILKTVARVFAGGERLPLEDGALSGRSVLILGMHRSGTSCLAGMLEERGLWLGDDVKTRSRHNKKGNRELKEVQLINNDLLGLGGGSWHRPRRATFTNAEITARIKKVYETLDASGKLWGIKDPRMLFCIDAWRNRQSMLVGTFRHPASVASSLIARENAVTREAHALELWHAYNAELVRLYWEGPFPVVDFDWDANRYCRAVAMIAGRLGLDASAGAFFEDGLRHNRDGGDIEDSRHRELYGELLDIASIEEKKLLEGRP